MGMIKNIDQCSWDFIDCDTIKNYKCSDKDDMYLIANGPTTTSGLVSILQTSPITNNIQYKYLQRDNVPLMIVGSIGIAMSCLIFCTILLWIKKAKANKIENVKS